MGNRMSAEKLREIASKGGRSAHQKGTAHEWTSEEARSAGHKGGVTMHRNYRELKARVRYYEEPREAPEEDL